MNHPLSYVVKTMIMILWTQMGQSNHYGKVRNNDIFNLRLGSGGDPRISTACFLHHTRHIH